MVQIEHQYRCSSKAIVYNTSIFLKRRQSYLIIDIEPTVDKSQPSNDQSFYSAFKDYVPYSPNRDTSVNNIILGIGAVAVILFLLVIIIKLIHKCYKMYQNDEDEEVKDSAKKSPLLPSASSNVIRRNSSIRNPLAPIHRSSLNIETLMEIRQNRLSQTYSNTPPIIKKP